MTELDSHEYANLFPLMSPPEIAQLAQDIRSNGQKQAIVLLNGKILDGRNRYKACLAANIEPRLVEYKGSDPLAYVLSLNLERRHLSPSQRAMIAAKVANMRQGERTDLHGPSTEEHVAGRAEPGADLPLSLKGAANLA